MLVIDKSVAFIGGMNIGDSWLPKKDGGEDWRDLMVRLEGPVVPVFIQIFDRLLPSLRKGHDDRGPIVESVKSHIFDGNLSLKQLILSILYRFSFTKVRDRVHDTVSKGKDRLAISILGRFSTFPKGSTMLVPFNFEKDNLLEFCNASSKAWWSTQGRLKLMFALNNGDSGVTEKGIPSLWIRKKSRKRLLMKITSQWSLVHSNIQVITNDAFTERNAIRRGYLRAIHAAKRRITIATSYFVPCMSIRRALYRASARGVDVRIVVPGFKTDMQYVRFATHAMYDQMLRHGIHLYEFLPSMMHMKLFIIDGTVSTIGSYNLDYRSWMNNLEIVAIIHDRNVAQALEASIQHDIEEKCEKVELSAWRDRPWLKKLPEYFFYLFRRQM